MQSCLPISDTGFTILEPSRKRLSGPITRSRQRRTLTLWSALCLTALLLRLLTRDPGLHAFALGLTAPGVGFLQWAAYGSDTQLWAILLAIAGFGLFCAAGIAWFATGNVLLIPLVWLGAALLSARPAWFGLDRADEAIWQSAGFWLPPMLPVIAWLILALFHRRKAAVAQPAAIPRPAAVAAAVRDEIAPDDLCRLRLLLDRALQPVEAFEGFEWRDQFQTAAIRYQINVLSYALAMAQHHYLPAATAAMTQAQQRLLAKQGDHRIWRYWALENGWGNLRAGRDPVPRDNIMYSGFVATQMALSDGGTDLRLFMRSREWKRYELGEIVALLASQYAQAPFGLLACEPNWIYPLCNMITATAIRAHDVRTGGRQWDAIADRFRHGLRDEFTDADGRLVAFRSSLTGFAPPSVGGAVMQAFPCLFLNSLFPDLAAAQWDRLRGDLRSGDLRRAFWPIDVGNYGFSRASSYAASAAAAVEMGDGEMAGRLLELLDAECPLQSAAGSSHRRDASLWAHALELIARLGRADGLRSIVQRPATPATDGPHVEHTPYPEMILAKARRLDRQTLRIVAHPAAPRCMIGIGIAGLMPDRHYHTGAAAAPFIRADATGRATIRLRIESRTELTITPVICRLIHGLLHGRRRAAGLVQTDPPAVQANPFRVTPRLAAGRQCDGSATRRRCGLHTIGSTAQLRLRVRRTRFPVPPRT